MLQTLRATYQVDMKRVYATGHSNGGGFTYLLWATRGHLLTAVAPTATSAGRLAGQFVPKPVFHLMGEADPLVKPEWQRATCRRILRINSCETEGDQLGRYITRYPSATGNPVVLFIHPGGHEYPAGANEAIIDFFRSIIP